MALCLAGMSLVPSEVRAQQVADAGAPSESASSSSSSSSGMDASLPAGVSLPTSGMIHAVDARSGGAVLVQLHPTEITSNSHAVGNFARSTVYAGPHASVELKGAGSAIRLESAQTSFLVRLTGDDPALLRGRVHLIRLQPTKDRRVVATFSQNIFGGQHTKKFNDVPIVKVDVEPDTWLKVTPEMPLEAGQYGLAIMPKDPNLFPDVVYDFEVAMDTGRLAQ